VLNRDWLPPPTSHEQTLRFQSVSFFESSAAQFRMSIRIAICG